MKWQASNLGKAIQITNGARTEQLPLAEAKSLYQALGTCFYGGSVAAEKPVRNASKGAKKGAKKSGAKC